MSRLIIRKVRLPEGEGLSEPVDLTIDGGVVTAITPTVEPAPDEADPSGNTLVGAGPTAAGQVAVTPASDPVPTGPATADGPTPIPADPHDPGGADLIEGRGRIALPGLIDAHTHAASAVFDPQIALALLRQGVTSVVVGVDGIGAAPADPGTARWSSAYFAAIDGPASPLPHGGTVADWLACYDETTPVNVAVAVPHGTLRHNLTRDQQRPASAAEIERLAALLDQGLDDGAVGLSTGLEYVPAAWADQAELAALTQVLARRGRPHISHMRGYEALAPGAVAELLDLARQARAVTGRACPTHISHYHGDAAVLAPLVDEAGAEGLDLSFDSYLYLRGCSILSMVALPRWLPLADPAAVLSALEDEATQARLDEHLATLDDLWPRTTMAWVPGLDPATGDALHWTEGLTLPEIAARLGVSPARAALRLLRASRLQASCVFAQPPTNSAASVLALAAHPRHMAGSDAIYTPFACPGGPGPDEVASQNLAQLDVRPGGPTPDDPPIDGGLGRPHPRGWGAFVRYLLLARDGEWSWPQVVEHTSTRAADRFGLGGRGRIGVGCPADIVLVDPESLSDQATYDQPRSLATGIDDVVVGGVPVLSDGVLTGATPGRGLRWSDRSGFGSRVGS